MEQANASAADWTTIDLAALGELIWSQLSQGASILESPWRSAVLTTFTAVPEDYATRLVILRQVNRADRTLTCYSDYRTPKVRHLCSNGNVQWLFYDPAANVQIRARGQARIHHQDDVARAAWSKTPPSNKINYCAVAAPGTELVEPGNGPPLDWAEQGSADEKVEIGFSNFAVLVAEIDAFDWLRVQPTGNRRARFKWDGLSYKANWLVP
jgi:pyridoxamine 5'-phosphate oxidase